ncbi:MAG: ABC transporter permease subunit [Mycoplasma sp.]
MLKYFLKRLGFTVVALVILLLLVFFLMQAVPGYPILRNNNDTDAMYLERVKDAGLLDNVFVQLWSFIEGIFTKGQFGQIYTSPSISVYERMLKPIQYSLMIAGPAFILAAIIGIFFGVLSAYYRGRWPDILINGISVIFVSIPSFIFALYLLQLAGVMGLPIQFVIPAEGTPNSKMFASMIIPILSMVLSSISTITYYTRNELVEVFKQDYIKVALAKGYTFNQVVWRYALRNAGIPILASLLPAFLAILSGSIIIEKFFNVPGTAMILIDSIQSKEFYLVIFSAIFYGGIYFLLQIIVDIAYSFIDPRIMLAERSADSYYKRAKAWLIRKKKIELAKDHNKFLNYFSNNQVCEVVEEEDTSVEIFTMDKNINVNLDYDKMVIDSKVNKTIKVDKEMFAPVDIYSISNEQIAGKPTTYFKDVVRRFFKSKSAVIFTVILGLILLITTISSLSSFNTVANPINTGIPATVLAYLPPRIPWLGISGIAPLITVDLDTYLFLLQYEHAGIWTSAEFAGGQYIIKNFNPYVIPALKDLTVLFGTDGLGRDWATMLSYSTMRSFMFALIVALPSVIIGTAYGAISGSYAGKWIDNVMMRFVEILSGVPLILWIIILGLAFSGGTLDLMTLGIALILVNWMGPAVTARTYILKYKDAEFVQAARTLGASQTRIIFSHMLPNISGRLFVRLVNIIPRIIFFEASLVFLGVKSATEISLGTMIETARNNTYPHLLMGPTLIMIIMTLSAQIIANNLNDALDPRVSGE